MTIRNFRVLVEILNDTDNTPERIYYRSSFASCVNFVGQCQRNLFPHNCHIRYYIQKLDVVSNTYYTISYTSLMISDLPF